MLSSSNSSVMPEVPVGPMLPTRRPAFGLDCPRIVDPSSPMATLVATVLRRHAIEVEIAREAQTDAEAALSTLGTGEEDDLERAPHLLRQLAGDSET